MELKDYKEIVELTAVYPQEVKDFGKVYTWLGLKGEFMEFLSAKTNEDEFKERFDVIWYAAAFCKEYELDFEKIFDDAKNCREDNYDYYPNWNELLKKYYRDDKPILKHAAESEVFFFIIEVLCGLSDEQIAEGLKQNYDKLMRRRETNTIHGDGDNRELNA
jgi:NTP pyrophosphatase (non-canonical NTP hydrolase)